jgi:hypothetical protein
VAQEVDGHASEVVVYADSLRVRHSFSEQKEVKKLCFLDASHLAHHLPALAQKRYDLFTKSNCFLQEN